MTLRAAAIALLAAWDRQQSIIAPLDGLRRAEGGILRGKWDGKHDAKYHAH